MSRIHNYFDIAPGTGDASALSGYAFPAVHKFDASGFYNWEEDNLPINDLETRSRLLQQHLGLDTAVTGVTLTVSAGAPQAASSTGTYQTVQEALQVVPRRLRIPFLIEICDFGDLGNLELNDIHAEGNGGLQIVCRQFLEDTDGSATTVSAASIYGPTATQTLPLTLSAMGGWVSDIANASSVAGKGTCSAVEPWDRHSRVYLQKRPDSQSEAQLLGFAQFPTQGGASFSAAASSFNFDGYNAKYETTVSADVNPKTLNGAGSPLLEERLRIEAGDKVTALAYGSYFRKIKITNCSRVKLQNICVDSASGVDYDTPNNMQYLCDTGIEISNSNILLENVAISRVKKTGVYINNSTVSTAKNFVIHRVYERTVNKSRLSEGVGVYLVDSSLALDTSAYDGSRYKLNSISKCGIGIHAVNSTIAGGTKSDESSASYSKNAGGSDLKTSILSVNGCNTGVKLENSLYDYDGRTDIFCNDKGFNSFQSTLIFPQFSVDDNQSEGFYLNKSTLKYGKYNDYFAASGTVSATTSSDLSKPGYCCDYNGINVYADKGSAVVPVDDCSVITNLDMWGGSYSGTGYGGDGKWSMASHGCQGNTAAAKVPAILISESSNAELVNLSVAGQAAAGGIGGICVRAEKNSSVTVRGTSKAATCLGSYGDLDSTISMDLNWTTAATAADANSNITFSGPTKISRYGIAVLASDNSKMSFGPPSDEGTQFVPDTVKFGLDSSSNHTMIDLHASRACLVASDKSVINMEALGASAEGAASSVDISQAASSLSSLFTSATSGSFVRFNPNGFTSNALGSAQVLASNFDGFTRTALSGAATSAHSGISTGGMCVRAVGSSKVNANLVNFKFDMPASSVSGAMYNYNGTGCEYDGTAASGAAASPTTDLCDLVTDCCTTYTTQATTTTPTSNVPTTTTTSTISSATPPTITSPTETFEVGGRGMANSSELGTTIEANFTTNGDIEFSCVGTRTHMWNIADTSRLHAANLMINRTAPGTACVNSTWHGPTGRWHNGAALDYYGALGLAAARMTSDGVGTSTSDGFYNLGIFRIVGSHKGYLKQYTEVDYGGFIINSQYVGGGSPMDQLGAQGYQTMFDTAISTSGCEDTLAYHVGLEPGTTAGTEPVFGRGLAGLPNVAGTINGIVTHASMTEGVGMLWDQGQLHPNFPIPPLHLGWQGYIRNWVDNSAADVFANARHGANKKVNLLSIYRSTTNGYLGGEGRDTTSGNPTFGVGVRSLNMFDLNRLV